MKMIDKSLDRLAKEIKWTTVNSYLPANEPEDALVLDGDTILINPAKNVPLKVVRSS